MTKVSKRILNKELEKYIFELFIKTIVEMKDAELTQNYFDDLLSPTERIMLIKRLAIAILLTKGYTYDKIDETLKVSRSTIMTVSYFLKNGKSGYQQVVNKILEAEKREELLDKIEEILIRLSPPKAYGTPAFKKKQESGKELYKRKLRRSLL